MPKLIRKMGRKILLRNGVRRLFNPVVDFYNNLPVDPLPEYLKIDLKGRLPQFHVGSVMSFGDKDINALNKVIEMAMCDKMTILEIGSWTGSSTNVLAKSVMGRGGNVYAVDHWRGSETIWQYDDITKKCDIFAIFRNNMEILGNQNIVHPLVMPSQIALKLFRDNFFDLIFIDGDHRYTPVKADILSCFPKLKDGGIICGHDAEIYYSKCSEENKARINAHLEEDCITDLCHPGVVKALHEIFGDKHTIVSNSVVWYYKPDEQSEE